MRSGILLLGALTLLGTSLLIPIAAREARARLGNATVESRLKEITPRVAPLWKSRLPCDAHDIDQLTLVVLKQEKKLIAFASHNQSTHRVAEYPILAASGTLGPKLKEGDRQVPEGFYKISFLNPNSRFHLSMRVDYPNAEDIAAAKADGRDTTNLGGDIMIHGGASSIGCVAIGDEAIEELFWLVATVGMERTELLFAPSAQLSDNGRLDHQDLPEWLTDRYARLKSVLESLAMN